MTLERLLRSVCLAIVFMAGAVLFLTAVWAVAQVGWGTAAIGVGAAGGLAMCLAGLYAMIPDHHPRYSDRSIEDNL